jgi:hypothetical protein
MNFTERHHAFISAAYYHAMKEAGLESFRDAFRLATRLYAEQRGYRMAQRAIRDGKPLSFPAYRHYREWVYTDEAQREFPDCSKVYMEDGDLYTRVFACPWSAQYLDMGLFDGAMDYCEDLDKAICRGFNPNLHYEVKNIIHEKGDYCLHCHHDPHAEEDAAYGPPRPENLKSFEYHCAHVYFTFSRVLTAIYKSGAAGIIARVLADFASQYGRDMADKLLLYRDCDFDTID